MQRARGVRGFTLAEMLVAIAIMVIAIGIAVPLFVGARARTRRSDAVNAVRAALAAARQQAVQLRTIVAVEFLLDASGTSGRHMILVDKSDLPTGTDRRLGAPIELPDFIEFQAVAPVWTLANGYQDDASDVTDTQVLTDGTSPPYPDIAFRADGTLADQPGTTDIAILDTVENLRIVLRVLPATGLVVEAAHLQNPDFGESEDNPRRRGWL